MSDAYATYTFVFLASLLLAVVIIGPKRLRPITRLGSFYLVILTLTYLVRPALLHRAGDDRLIRFWKIGGLESVLCDSRLRVRMGQRSAAIIQNWNHQMGMRNFLIAVAYALQRSSDVQPDRPLPDL